MYDFQESDTMTKRDVIASYQQAIIDTLVEKMKRALKTTKAKTCVIAGGVAANKCLRNQLTDSLENTRILFPELSYCTDNAAMISFLGELKYNSDNIYSLDFGVQPNLKLA
jgi:N6-L-threonylcarbamoyladenine synthase